MKVIINGSKSYGMTAPHTWDYRSIWKDIDTIVKENLLDVSSVISTGNPGPPRAGEMWSSIYGIPCSVFTPKWRIYGLDAEPNNNAKIAELCDIMIMLDDGTSPTMKHVTSVVSNMGKAIYTLKGKS